MKKEILIFFLALCLSLPVFKVKAQDSCQYLIEKYASLLQYDQNKNGFLDWEELLKVLQEYFADRLSLDIVEGALKIAKQRCSFPVNSPVQGTLSVSPTQVKAGDPIQITVVGKDEDGVKAIYAYFGGTWNSYSCDGQTYCEHTWTTKEIQPGTYSYYGYVRGLTKAQTNDDTWTTPTSIKVTVVSTGTVPPSIGTRVQGTLEVSPTQVGVGEPIKITVTGRDNDGVRTIYAYFGGRWNSYSCDGLKVCSYTWTTREEIAGTYYYYGYVRGQTATGEKEDTWTVPQAVTVVVSGTTPAPVSISLPDCDFSGSAGIYAKPKDCDWSGKVLLGTGNTNSCVTGLILKHTISAGSGQSGFVQTVGSGGVGEGTDLCKIGTDSSALPTCPFSGTKGEIWVKPRFENPVFTWTWDSGKCKLGKECSLSRTFDIWQFLLSLGLVSGSPQKTDINVLWLIEKVTGLRIPEPLSSMLNFTVPITPDMKIGPELYTHSDTPQRAWCGIKIPPVLTGSLPCEFCIVR